MKGCISVTVLAAISMAFSSAHAKVRVGMIEGIPSAINYSEGKFSGTYGSYYQCVLEKLPGGYDVIPLPLTRLIFSLESGEVDIAIPMLKTKERDKFAMFSDPIKESSFLIFVKTPQSNHEELNGKTIATMRSGAHVEVIMSRHGILTEVTNYESALKMAATGRVDAAVIPDSLENALSHLTHGLYRDVFWTQNSGIYTNNKLLDLHSTINSLISTCKQQKTT